MSVGKASLSRAAAKAKEQAPAEEVKKAPEKKTAEKTTAKAAAKAAPKRTRAKKAAEEKAVPMKKTGVSKSTAMKGGPVMAVAPEQMQEQLEEKIQKVRTFKSNLICDLPTWLL